MWKFIIGCVTISTQKIMRWLENVAGLFLMNPDRFRFLTENKIANKHKAFGE